ncbi:signal peptidase I [Actinotalea sp. K2]|uniref:signal peptidase I n=1 Tax=Actinotalea sp. K2 TaxID=2939438 RepID=UPI002016C140|nr:signal peptidase I [Actinotalea sp. K2]MCL3860240.1 signal peptidase I [Actinotalea sp. K2]
MPPRHASAQRSDDLPPASVPGAAHHDPSGTGPAAPPPRRGGGLAAWLRETFLIVGSALVLSLLIKTFLVQAFFIPSSSMEPTLLIGDRVLVNKLAPGPFEMNRGDIVVFKDPGGWLPPSQDPPQPAWREALTTGLTFIGLVPQDSGEHLIKRVVGLPGDVVECCDEAGRLTVNGVPLDEEYLAPGSRPSEIEFTAVVPTSGVWVMGDNRQNSQDSRYKQGDPGGGSIPVENVVGVSFVTVWPIDRWSVIRSAGSTFEQVPEP